MRKANRTVRKPISRPAVLEPLEPRRLFASLNLGTVADFNGTGYESPTSVVEDQHANLFGLCSSSADGTRAVFEVPAGKTTVTIVHQFTGGSDGGDPTSLVVDASGNLFGTAISGGADLTGAASSDGGIFEIVAGSTTPSYLYAFKSAQPSASTEIIGVDSSGNLFGRGASGLFELASGSTTLKGLGSVSANTLLLGPDGNIYGTQYNGVNSDKSSNAGEVFEVNTADASVKTLATLPGTNAAGTDTDGSGVTGITVDASGNVFGVTNEGGNSNSGTAFEIVKGSGTATVLVKFDRTSKTVGGQPRCAPVLDQRGDLIGVNAAGGANGDGAVWEIPTGVKRAEDLVDLTSSQTGTAAFAGQANQSSVVNPDASASSPITTARTITIVLTDGGADAAKGAGLLETLTPAIPLSTSNVTPTSVTGNVPSAVVSGARTNATVNVTALNTSSSTVSGNLKVQLYVSVDGGMAHATPIGVSVTKKVTLKPSQSVRIPVRIKSFPTETAGMYKIVAAITDSSGNTSTVAGSSITIAPPFVKTVVSAVQVSPASSVRGRTETLAFTLTNSGNTTATGSASLAIGLSTDAAGDAPESITSELFRIKLAPGAHKRYVARFKLPASLAAGTYHAVASLNVAALGDSTAGDGVGVSVNSVAVK